MTVGSGDEGTGPGGSQQGPSQQGTSQQGTGQHGGTLAVAAAQAHGVSTMFTLSGGHVFPLYDAA
ncbi:MAG TPA: hypothetical protein VF933_36430, partial [Streptosporangiaceae bacterium]